MRRVRHGKQRRNQEKRGKKMKGKKVKPTKIKENESKKTQAQSVKERPCRAHKREANTLSFPSPTPPATGSEGALSATPFLPLPTHPSAVTRVRPRPVSPRPVSPWFMGLQSSRRA